MGVIFESSRENDYTPLRPGDALYPSQGDGVFLEDGPGCDASSPSRMFWCTRLSGHSGRHVAIGGGPDESPDVYAIWDD